MKNIFIILSAAVISLIAINSKAQFTQAPESLKSYIEIALSQNADVLATRSKWQNTDAKVDESAAAFYPRLDFTSRFTRFSGGRVITIPTIGAINTSGLGLPVWDNKFEMVWPIGNYAIWQSNSAAHALRDAATSEVSAKELDVQSKVSEVYYQYAKAAELVQVRKNALNLAEENLKLSKALFNSDKVQKNDVLRAEVQVASAEGEVIGAKRMQTLARTSFNSMLNRSSDADINLPSDGEIRTLVGMTSDVAYSGNDIDSRLALPSLKEDAERAFSSRPELSQLSATEIALEDFKKVNSSDYFPNISFFASYGWQEDHIKFSSDADNLVGGFLLRWNLFSGFGTNAKVRESEAQIEELRHQRESAINGIRLEIESARTDKISAIERLYVAKKYVSSADENYRITKLQYDNGTTSLINLVDAEISLSNAKASFTTATYDLMIAEAKYKKALGIR